MSFGHSRRPFPRPSARRRHAPAGYKFGLAGPGGPKAQTVSRSVSLALAAALVSALVYALFKFFSLLRARHLDLRELWFVPAAIAAVILVVLLRVVRPLLREILTKTSPK